MRDDIHLHRVDYHSYPALRGEIMTTAQQLIMPVLARVFVAATWYDTANVRSTLYCKAREVIVGDRAEKMAQDEIDGAGQPARGEE